MNTFTKVALKGCAGLMVGIVGSVSCLAIDYQPGDWVPLPPDTGVLMGYYEFGTRNEYNNTITGTAKTNTHLDSNIGVARYLYYNEVFHYPYVLDFIVPFGALTHGEINGKNLGSASGLNRISVWSCASQNFSTSRLHFASGKWPLSKRASLERRNCWSPSGGNLNSVRGQIEPEAPGC